MDTELFDVISSKTINASRFEITEDELKIDDKKSVYSFVKIKPGICVIIETPEGFVVLNEYRYPIKKWSYEFAAGIIDPGEEPKDAAIREVREETGFIVDEIRSLGKFYPSFGATDEVIYLFHAVCKRQGQTAQEFTEFITYELMNKDKINSLIISGEFKHGAGLAAWLKYILTD